MRTTSGIQFYCRPCKTDKSGYAPIEVSVTINQKRTIFHLPRKEKPAEFEKQLRSRKCDLVDYCDTIRITINNAQTELLKRGIAVTADRLKEYVRSGGIKTYTVNDMVNEYMDILRLKTGMSAETFKKYRIIYDRFIDYVGAETEANMIGTGVMSKFNAIIYNENVESTAGGKMTKIKSLLRWAFECGKIPTMPMSNIRITKGKVKKEFLTPAEVMRIKTKKFSIERLNRVRDLFVFQMSTGLSYVDIESVREILEKDGVFFIKGKRQKTGIEFTSVVLPEGVAVWNKYQGQLPILTNQKYNSYLKEIGDLCETKTLTTHLARKTYATNMLNAGVAITTVSRMLGHSNSNITQKHYATLIDDTILNEVKKII